MGKLMVNFVFVNCPRVKNKLFHFTIDNIFSAPLIRQHDINEVYSIYFLWVLLVDVVHCLLEYGQKHHQKSALRWLATDKLLFLLENTENGIEEIGEGGRTLYFFR